MRVTMRYYFVFIISLFIICNKSTFAGNYIKGETLLYSCNGVIRAKFPLDFSDPDNVISIYCSALLEGIINTNRSVEFLDKSKEHVVFCEPEAGLTTREAARIVVKFFETTPEALHKPGVAFAIGALSRAFPLPCK